MMRPIQTFLLISSVFVILSPAVANAQRRYQPRRPTLSPYLDLFRQDNGLLDPYNAQVVPRRQVAQEFDALQGTIDRQDEEINRLNGQLQSDESGATQTGKGGSYLNYSHFYGSQAASEASRNVTGSRPSSRSRTGRSNRLSGYSSRNSTRGR